MKEEKEKADNFNLNCSSTCAVPRRRVLPAVTSIQQLPVAVVAEVALVDVIMKNSSLILRKLTWSVHRWAIASISTSHTISIMFAAGGWPGSSPLAILSRLGFSVENYSQPVQGAFLSDEGYLLLRSL